MVKTNGRNNNSSNKRNNSRKSSKSQIFVDRNINRNSRNESHDNLFAYNKNPDRLISRLVLRDNNGRLKKSYTSSKSVMFDMKSNQIRQIPALTTVRKPLSLSRKPSIYIPARIVKTNSRSPKAKKAITSKLSKSRNSSSSNSKISKQKKTNTQSRKRY